MLCGIILLRSEGISQFKRLRIVTHWSVTLAVDIDFFSWTMI